MNYWLMKSEPSSYSWRDMARDGKTNWNGVRNYQANNSLKAMKKGDCCFFYHSGDERAIMGIMKIAQGFYPDQTDKTGKFGMVDVEIEKPLKSPVTLADIKKNPALKSLALIKQSRLSVMPVGEHEWNAILKMAAA
jgi:predicted RNA-binding protein with PUA-like domain